MERILPSPYVTVREWDFDGVPASIEVVLGNKTTETFIRMVKQPKPQCADTYSPKHGRKEK